jgi:hypothetical protein
MITILFVQEQPYTNFDVGFRLSSINWKNAPEGIIRVARFRTAFDIENKLGYYGDIYLKMFIKKWKKITYDNIQRKKDRMNCKIILNNNFNDDILSVVIGFL